MNDSRPHVLHLVRWYPYAEDPMYGLFIRRHILALRSRVRSTVIFVRPDAESGQIHRIDATEDGLREIRVTYPERSPRTINFLAFMRLVWGEARGVHRADPVDLVHVHVLTRLGAVARALKWRYGIPYAITEHWSRYIDDRYRGVLRRWATHRVVSDAGALINVSRYLQDAMENRGLRTSLRAVIPNVVDCEVFDLRPTGDAFVHVSCFQRAAKNIFGLIEAMATAADRGYDFRLQMVGVGEVRSEAMALARELGVSERIEFPGLLQGRALADCVGKARALVVYSDYETGPVVALEALAAGVPVISTRVGGVSEVVDEQNGILIDPGDADALIAALERLSTDAELFDRAEIRRRACHKFGVDAVARSHWEVYAKILEENSEG